MEPFDYFLRFGVALGIGFMVGLQREFAFRDSRRALIAGERTLALIGLAGAMAAFITDLIGTPLVFLGVIGLIGIFTAIAYYIDAGQGQVGLTTEITILIVVLTGALCYWDQLTLAVAIGIVTTVLLSLKLETDRLVSALTRDDILAALQLAVISAIILPVLPNESLWPAPFDVLNPFNIWLMVVFISGINFLGYVSIKVVGPERGIGITGLLGGLASSTGVTLSFTERSNREPMLAKAFTLAITVAWTVMFARVIVEVGVINPPLLRIVWLPIAAAGAAGLLYSAYLYRLQHSTKTDAVEFSNPFDLSTAIKFGLLYAVILLVARTAQMYFGDAGVLFSSVVSGLADVDAITLSISELNDSGGLEARTAAQAIVLAAMSNTVVKGAMVMIGGAPSIRKVILPGLLLILGTGIVTALLTI